MAMPFSKRAFRFSSVYLLAFALAFSAITVPRDLTTSTDFFILKKTSHAPIGKSTSFLDAFGFCGKPVPERARPRIAKGHDARGTRGSFGVTDEVRWLIRSGGSAPGLGRSGARLL